DASRPGAEALIRRSGSGPERRRFRLSSVCAGGGGQGHKRVRQGASPVNNRQKQADDCIRAPDTLFIGVPKRQAQSRPWLPASSLHPPSANSTPPSVEPIDRMFYMVIKYPNTTW